MPYEKRIRWKTPFWKKKKKIKEKKKKSEHSYNNGREFFKFGHVEIEKQKFNSSKSVTTISNVDIDKIAMASNNFPCDIKSFKWLTCYSNEDQVNTTVQHAFSVKSFHRTNYLTFWPSVNNYWENAIKSVTL